MKNIYLDYNQISLRLDVLVEEIRKENFDGLVIVLRGGSFIGMHTAFLTDLPYAFLRYDRPMEKVEWVGDKIRGKKILLCEDIAGSGRTLINCKKFLESEGYEVKTLVVAKDWLSASEPDYYCFDNQDRGKRFIFPWERYRVNESVTSENDGYLDTVHERYGVDSRIFDEIDLMYGEKVEINGEGILTIVDLGRHILDHYCTHYVSSNAEEALLLASEYPELRIYWWNGERLIGVQGY